MQAKLCRGGLILCRDGGSVLPGELVKLSGQVPWDGIALPLVTGGFFYPFISPFSCKYSTHGTAAAQVGWMGGHWLLCTSGAAFRLARGTLSNAGGVTEMHRI